MSAERAVEFETAWCATDLGDYRSCAYTYEDYPYDSLPPLDSARFTGAFEWLGGTTAPAPERAAILDRLATDLAARGLTLPQDFAAFHTDAAFHRSLDEVSVTGCWTHLSGPIPSPVEPGAFLVRFLRDQQDCVIWYLYLRASGEAFVVHCSLDLDEPDALDGQQPALLWCAPSFEEFAYRFWVENRLWEPVNNGESASIEPELRDYLSHYAPPEGV
ncbi:hypothetical protein [Streptomyces sp. NPDC059597]|uniref:hypothetical protein n=1 Tax=Streptomyces sp. NPDC059597 TaxID=3346879 RepID=UPI0036AD2AB4